MFLLYVFFCVFVFLFFLVCFFFFFFFFFSLYDAPRAASCGVYIHQLIRFARVSSHVSDFNNQNLIYSC